VHIAESGGNITKEKARELIQLLSDKKIS